MDLSQMSDHADMLFSKKKQSGFTFIELIVVLSVITTLLGLASINLIGSQQRAVGSSTLDVLLSDIRSQQLKAMLGDSEGRLTADSYGVLLSPTKYTLFHGPSYSPWDLANVVVPLDGGTTIQNITFPGGEIVFSSGSGELVHYTFGQTSFTISTKGGVSRSVQLNKYGTVTYVN